MITAHGVDAGGLCARRSSASASSNSANQALGRLNILFNVIYAATGRESIAPEQLLRTLLLQLLYWVRSERMRMQQYATTCCFAGS